MSSEINQALADALDQISQELSSHIDDHGQQIRQLWDALGAAEAGSSADSAESPTESPREQEQRRREAAWLQRNGIPMAPSLTPLCIHCAHAALVAYTVKMPDDEWVIHCQALHTETAVEQAPLRVCTKHDAVEPIDPRTPHPDESDGPRERPPGAEPAPRAKPRSGPGMS